MALNGKSLPEEEFVSLRHNKGGKARAISRSEGQGKKSKNDFYTCKQCGFRVNKSTTSHIGGSLSGNGGYGAVTKTAGDSVEDLKSDTFTDGTVTRSMGVGEQVVKKGAACPMCGSLNWL